MNLRFLPGRNACRFPLSAPPANRMEARVCARVALSWVTLIGLLVAGAVHAGESGLVYFPLPDAEPGWRTLTDADEIRRVAGMDQQKLDEAFKFIQGSTKNGGLLVVRDGWLVYERYFGLGHREAAPNLASCGKSFTSIAVGILMAERPDLFPDGLNQRVFTPAYFPPEAFPLSDPRKKDITLGQLLTFSAGIRGNNPAYVHGRATTIHPIGPDGWPSMVDGIALGKQDGANTDGTPFTAATLWCDPGGGYSYATSSIHLASIMLRHVTGMELQEYVDKRLAQPLGWGRWGYGYKNAPKVTHTPGGGGIALRATDMLRFGYLLLREGRWNDRQLVPAEYVRLCARQSTYNPHYPYSLQFNVNTDGHVPELPRDAFWKSGSGGHVLYIIPSLDLVVWKIGGRDEQYSPNNTGLPRSPATAEQVAARSGWRETVDKETALQKTLQLVIESIVNPGRISLKDASHSVPLTHPPAAGTAPLAAGWNDLGEIRELGAGITPGICVSYRDHTSGESRLTMLDPDGDRFAAPIAIAPAITLRSRWNAHLAAAPGGGAYVVWDANGRVYFRAVGEAATHAASR